VRVVKSRRQAGAGASAAQAAVAALSPPQPLRRAPAPLQLRPTPAAQPSPWAPPEPPFKWGPNEYAEEVAARKRADEVAAAIQAAAPRALKVTVQSDGAASAEPFPLPSAPPQRQPLLLEQGPSRLDRYVQWAEMHGRPSFDAFEKCLDKMRKNSPSEMSLAAQHRSEKAARLSEYYQAGRWPPKQPLQPLSRAAQRFPLEQRRFVRPADQLRVWDAFGAPPGSLQVRRAGSSAAPKPLTPCAQLSTLEHTTDLKEVVLNGGVTVSTRTPNAAGRLELESTNEKKLAALRTLADLGREAQTVHAAGGSAVDVISNAGTQGGSRLSAHAAAFYPQRSVGAAAAAAAAAPAQQQQPPPAAAAAAPAAQDGLTGAVFASVLSGNKGAYQVKKPSGAGGGDGRPARRVMPWAARPIPGDAAPRTWRSRVKVNEEQRLIFRRAAKDLAWLKRQLKIFVNAGLFQGLKLTKYTVAKLRAQAKCLVLQRPGLELLPWKWVEGTVDDVFQSYDQVRAASLPRPSRRYGHDDSCSRALALTPCAGSDGDGEV